MPRVRIGLRGKEQLARITGVANMEGHGCSVGVNLTIPSGALPDVGVAFETRDPNTAILARKLVAALDAAGIDWRETTEHHVRLHLALERVRLSIVQLQSARGEVGVVLGDQHEGYELANKATEAARDLYRSIEAQILRPAR